MNDREKVKAELDEIVEQCRGMGYIGFSTITEHCQNILAMLKEQEADMIALKNAYKELAEKGSVIVPCKDCKHCYFASNRIPCEQTLACGKHGMDITPDWFCADGVKKDD